MKKRWRVYLLAGVLFGIFDFYFQIWINRIFPVGSISIAVMMIPILGVWLALVTPIAAREAKASRSLWRTAAASAFSWCVAVVTYYLFMGAKLVLIGEASRPEMRLSNRADPYYWSNIKGFFEGDFLSGVSEWIVIALVGGCLVGLAIGFLTLRAQKNSDRTRDGIIP